MFNGTGADILRTYILQAIAWLYIGFVAALLSACLWFPRRRRQKIVWAGAVLLVFVVPLCLIRLEDYRISETHKARYKKAKALFDERCKTAGEKIYKTVENVEGVLLLEVWPRSSKSDWRDPQWSIAGLPNQRDGNDYIESFVLWERPSGSPDRGYLINTKDHARYDGDKMLPGYAFVDVKEADGFVYRYRPRVPPEFKIMGRERLSGTMARYAISFRGITTNPADRDQWVAGMTVLITDTKNNEVIAEKTWYSFNAGFGSRSVDISHWLFAHTCPTSANGKMRGLSPFETRFFVDQVLKPKQEN